MKYVENIAVLYFSLFNKVGLQKNCFNLKCNNL